MMDKLKNIAKAIWRIILPDCLLTEDERLEELENVVVLDMLNSDHHASHDA